MSAGSPIPALALCALLAAPGAAAQEPAAAARELTLAEALRRALFANPALGRARAEIDAAQAQRRGALALILPRLTASGSLLRNSTEVTFGTDEDRRVLLPITDWNARLVLQQPVFAGLREQRAYQQAREGVRAAEQGLVAAQDRVLLRTATDYLGVVQGELLLEVERRALALARERLAQAQSVYEAGEATRVDVLRAESDVKAAERRVTLAVRQREVAAGQLRVDLDLDGEVAVREPAAELPPRPDEAGLMERAERARGDLQQARSNVHIAVLEVAKQKGAYLPVLTADAGWIWQKTTFPTDRYGFAALRVSVPLWQSGEIGARVATARARARQAELQLAEARRQVREDVRRALLDVQTAELDLALAEEQLAASEAEYQQVFELYRGQEATSLDVQASEAGLSAARRAVVNGRLARVLAELLAWFAAGDMRSALVEEVQP